MKTTIKVLEEIEIIAVRISVPVLSGEEDIPNDFPLRHEDNWCAEVEMDTGRIVGWPKGKGRSLSMQVCDGGTYQLIGKDGFVIAQVHKDYVPGGVIPTGGDYIVLEINTDGVITNWPKRPDVSAFFRGEE